MFTPDDDQRARSRLQAATAIGERWSEAKAYANTDRELWREDNGAGESMSYYEPSIHVTQDGRIGINVGGYVFQKTLREWHALAVAESDAEVRAAWSNPSPRWWHRVACRLGWHDPIYSWGPADMARCRRCGRRDA